MTEFQLLQVSIRHTPRQSPSDTPPDSLHPPLHWIFVQLLLLFGMCLNLCSPLQPGLSPPIPSALIRSCGWLHNKPALGDTLQASQTELHALIRQLALSSFCLSLSLTCVARGLMPKQHRCPVGTTAGAMVNYPLGPCLCSSNTMLRHSQEKFK